MTPEQVELYGFYLQIGGLLAGPLLALIPILTWELRIKPRRERQQLARTLSREIRYNLDLLESSLEADTGNALVPLPSGFQCSTVAFDALAQRVAELEPRLATKVIFLYSAFARLNRIANTHETRLSDRVLAAEGMNLRQDETDHLSMTAAAARQQRELAIRGSREVLADLASVTGERRLLPGGAT